MGGHIEAFCSALLWGSPAILCLCYAMQMKHCVEKKTDIKNKSQYTTMLLSLVGAKIGTIIHSEQDKKKKLAVQRIKI